MVLNIQKWNKIMELFFLEENKKFAVREIAKKTKIPFTSVQRYLNELKKEGLITKENKSNVNDKFKDKKILFMLDKILDSRAIDFLNEQFAASCIILFGSARKGEYDKDSDIDIFIESTKKKEVDLTKFEKKLKHRIQLFVEEDIQNLPENLLSNVINGIKLRGYLKLK